MSFARSRTLTEKSISHAEGWAVLAFCMAASAVAIVWSWRHGAMLNYGDAVAHLHIARRVFDSRTPRFSQLGSVWLPLPHILLLPFVQNYAWWATGLAGVIPSALAYLASCAGIYRLARHWLSPAPAALALVFFALNPNLLYLQTTAMTEPLFLCEMIWIVVWLVEWRAALDEETRRSDQHSSRQRAQLREPRAFRSASPPLSSPPSSRATTAGSSRSSPGPASAFTLLRRAAAGERGTPRCAGLLARHHRRRRRANPLVRLQLRRLRRLALLRARPLLRHAIELRTAANAPGWPPHPGWHNPWVALLFYLKVSELDSVAAPGWGNALGQPGSGARRARHRRAWLRRKNRARRRALAWTLLLWLPVPFYAWSVAYGSVPIFFPAWWPYTWYNTRYGLELLPALALGLGSRLSSPSTHFAARLLKRPALRDLRAASSQTRLRVALCSRRPQRLRAPARRSHRLRRKHQECSTRASPTTMPFLRLLQVAAHPLPARHRADEYIDLS